MNLMLHLVNVIGWALLHFVWQGSLIAIVLAVLLTLLKNASAQTRYALACSALLLCFAKPLGYIFQHFSFALIVPADTARLSMDATTGIFQAAGVAQILQNNLPVLVTLWGGCVLFLALRLMCGLAWVSRKGRTGDVNQHWQGKLNELAGRMDLTMVIGLRLRSDIASPLTAGYWKPVVLLPAALLTNMPVAMLEALLAHELAHIKRHDYLINVLQTCIEMLLFYHPAVWWISRQIRQEREHIADDLAARTLGEPRRLALALQRLELIQSSTPQLAQAAQGGNLMSRIKRLVKPEVQAVNWKSAVALLTIATACTSLAAHALTGTALASTQKESDAPAGLVKIMHRSKPEINFRNCAPEYPRGSMRRGETGITRIAVHVNADGSVAGSKIDHTSGYTDLDKAVSDTVMQCKGQPKLVNGKPVDAWVKVQYVWKLQ